MSVAGSVKPSPPKFVFRLAPTTWGSFGVVFTTQGKLAATFLPQPEKQVRRMVGSKFPSASEQETGADEFCELIGDYFHGRKVSWKVEIDWGDISGFRRRVLEACRRIPHGATASYADLAKAAGSPGAARAVGSAMASNPLPLIVPCHRVLRSDGSLGGFSSPLGPSQKERMLKLENPNFGITYEAKSAPRAKVGLPRSSRPKRPKLLPFS